jgi:uncharacterized protein YcfL
MGVKMKKSVLGCLIAGVLAACANTVNTDPDKIYINELADLGYIKNISVSDAQNTSNSLQRVTVTGETNKDVTLYYSVIWFDDNGMKINTTLSKPVKANVRKSQPFHWTAVAPSEKATSYKVYVASRAIEQ